MYLLRIFFAVFLLRKPYCDLTVSKRNESFSILIISCHSVRMIHSKTKKNLLFLRSINYGNDNLFFKFLDSPNYLFFNYLCFGFVLRNDCEASPQVLCVGFSATAFKKNHGTTKSAQRRATKIGKCPEGKTPCTNTTQKTAIVDRHTEKLDKTYYTANTFLSKLVTSFSFLGCCTWKSIFKLESCIYFGINRFKR